jgi:hypothetical protein
MTMTRYLVFTKYDDGLDAGLAQLEPLDSRLAGNHRLDAVRGTCARSSARRRPPPSITAEPPRTR